MVGRGENAQGRGTAGATTATTSQVDAGVSKRFWRERATAHDPRDPRTVTLDTDSRSAVAREVALYQQWLLRRLEGRALATAVDLGCGNGDWTVVLARRAQRTIAVDFTAELLDACRAYLEAAAPDRQVAYAQADVAAYDLVELSELDLIVCGGVLQYLGDDDVQAVLARAARALRPRQGHLYMRVTVAKNAERRSRCDDRYQAIYRSRAWYDEALAHAGLRVTASQCATDFVADEVAHKWLGPVLAPGLSWPLRLVRRAYRAGRPTDVYACLVTPR